MMNCLSHGIHFYSSRLQREVKLSVKFSETWSIYNPLARPKFFYFTISLLALSEDER